MPQLTNKQLQRLMYYMLVLCLMACNSQEVCLRGDKNYYFEKIPKHNPPVYKKDISSDFE